MASKEIDLAAYIEKKRKKRDLQHYWVSFAMMILFTLLAFWTVMMKDLNSSFKSMFILALAIVQVIYQLYYFMHLKERSHQYPTLFIYSGALVALITIITFMTMIWW